MELLELTPSELGVTIVGIYVVDDDGAHVVAGPFETGDAALAWINNHQQGMLSPEPSLP